MHVSVSNWIWKIKHLEIFLVLPLLFVLLDFSHLSTVWPVANQLRNWWISTLWCLENRKKMHVGYFNECGFECSLHLVEEWPLLKCAWCLSSIFVGIVLKETTFMLKQSLCSNFLTTTKKNPNQPKTTVRITKKDFHDFIPVLVTLKSTALWCMRAGIFYHHSIVWE